MDATIEAGRLELLAERFERVRERSLEIAAPLSPEDCVVQSMTEASPIKWQLAHTTWFFETFVLGESASGYTPLDSNYGYLFNSYYETVGDRVARPERGLQTRPALSEVMAYREHIDAAMRKWLRSGPDDAHLDVLELGLHHEQQHQELMLTDLKHLLSWNTLDPVYRPNAGDTARATGLSFVPYEGGLVEIGSDGHTFAFDNEGPRHRKFLVPFELASRPATNAEYLEFMRDGGYERAELWLSEGWDLVRAERWRAPLYWREEEDGSWTTFTLAGRKPVAPDEPVVHLSLYEADAYASWTGMRLPTESEWEHAATGLPVEGRMGDLEHMHPRPSPPADGAPAAMFGDVWEWTRSAYVPYPGYRAVEGALGEYNGKFMANQTVLRGGSCATSPGHIRASYRNFFHAHARWQFSGVRLARDV